jgi:acetyl-CoA C-acetyltransferase
MNTAPERIPVIVGVGQVNDRPAIPDQGLDPAQLAEAALRRADADAGGGWLPDLESLALVDQISFPDLGDFSHSLAVSIGASPRYCTKTETPTGDSPILLLNEAANRIGAGEIRMAAIVGAEALRTAASRAAATATNAMRRKAADSVPTLNDRYGVVAPTDIYPLYENAARAAWAQSLAEAQSESATIWAGMSDVAAANPHAWLRKPVDAQTIATPTAENRPIAFPYTKLMVANLGVNQGAGFIIASLAEARRRGVAEDRIIYVGRGAAAHEVADPLKRARYDISQSMITSITRTLTLNDLTAADLDHVELYSCFPCVPKMARRILDWPVDRPMTVFGGLTFGGGPVGNYMSHAVASMVDTLRAKRGRGLLFANGGYASHYHSIIVSSDPIPAAIFPHSFDYQHEADATRGPAPPLRENAPGPATLETYTVLYSRDGAPKSGIVIARTPDGARTIASVPHADDQTLAFLTNGRIEPVGTLGMVTAGDDGRQTWTPAG